MNTVNIQHIPQRIGRVHQARIDSVKKQDGQFQEILRNSLKLQNGLKFSAHAIERLRSRSISLSGNDIIRLNNAVSKAEDKGSRDSLVLMNDLAFVVSVKNKTVVTAMTNSQMHDNIVTKIDSAVIA